MVSDWGEGLAVALGDRVELSTMIYGTTRQIDDSNGVPHHGEVMTSIRGKIRLGDFAGGRGAFGIQLSRSATRRERTDVQDERLSALNFALPVEFHALTSGPFMDQRLTVYAAPRLVLQSFKDRLNRRRDITGGTLAGAVAGVAARLRYFATIAEMDLRPHSDDGVFGNDVRQWLARSTDGQRARPHPDRGVTGLLESTRSRYVRARSAG